METLVKKTNGKASKADASVKSAASRIKSAEKNAAAKPEVKPEVKPAEKKTTEKVVEKAPELSLEQKIEKIENLKTLIEKREKLEYSRKKLSSFVVGANQFNENIVLTDENGNTFKTSNSEVFTKVVSTINETLIEKIAEIEKQIEF